MQLQRWSLAKSTLALNLTSGAVESYFTLWYVDSCHLKILKLLICTKRFSQVTIKFQSSYLRTVLISYPKFWTQTQRSVMVFQKSEVILGSSNRRIGVLRDCFRDKSPCLSMIRCTRWCSTNSTTTLTTLSSALKLTDIIKSQPLIIYSLKRRWGKIKISLTQRVKVLLIW